MSNKFIFILILFFSLTHVTQAQTWTQLSPTGSAPTSRSAHTAVYDVANNRMTIFGGNSDIGNVNDVWVLSTTNGMGGTPAWTQLFLTGSIPTTRALPSSVYDAINNRMTLFGGTITNDGSLSLNDTWVLSTANGLGGTSAWTQLSPTGSIPTTRFGHTAIYDTANNRMTIFGGRNSSGNLNDVWVLSTANGLGGTPTWTKLLPIGSTSALSRYRHTVVYDTTNNRMIIFGGEGNSGFLNDVWVLSNANGLGGMPAWSKLSTTGSAPLSRAASSAVYDALNNRMTIFGGFNGDSLNDIWMLSNANGLGGTPAWTQLLPTGSNPTTRFGHTAIYDNTNNLMILFGGVIGGITRLNDVWVFDPNGIPTSIPKRIWELLDD